MNLDSRHSLFSSFRLASRRFIQELFLEVDFSRWSVHSSAVVMPQLIAFLFCRMDEEAMHVLGQNHISWSGLRLTENTFRWGPNLTQEARPGGLVIDGDGGDLQMVNNFLNSSHNIHHEHWLLKPLLEEALSSPPDKTPLPDENELCTCSSNSYCCNCYAAITTIHFRLS